MLYWLNEKQLSISFKELQNPSRNYYADLRHIPLFIEQIVCVRTTDPSHSFASARLIVGRRSSRLLKWEEMATKVSD